MKNKIGILSLLGLLALTSCEQPLTSNSGAQGSTEPGTSIVDSTTSGTTSSPISTSTGGVSNGTSTSINSTVTSTETPDNVEGNYQYFIQTDSAADRSFMRTPYIPNVVSNAPANYYANAEGKSGSTLLNALKSIISSARTNYDWPRFWYVDEDPYNTSNVWLIYVRDSYDKNDKVGGTQNPGEWNREHTYPESKLGRGTTPTKDSQLIFADDHKTNSIRGNNVFGEVAHSSNTVVRDSSGRLTANWSTNSAFEPCDAAKGEVARATLYTYVLYGKPIENNFTSIDLCLKWHKEFPPTSWEMLRNNRNYYDPDSSRNQAQGNRNPFIDHPEYADLLF